MAVNKPGQYCSVRIEVEPSGSFCPLSFPPIPSGLAPQVITPFAAFLFPFLVRQNPFCLESFYLPKYLLAKAKCLT